MVWETSDTLFRLFALLLLFLPVHKYGLSEYIIEQFQKKPKSSNVDAKQEDAVDTANLRTSCPMWPFRIFQGLWTMIYFSTSLCVWNNEHYKTGNVLFYIRNSDNWNPMFSSMDSALANITVARYAAWTTMALFSTCWWLVWVVPPHSCSRTMIVTTMVTFHLFVETLTNTCFLNTLLALGWLTFLVQPDATLRPAPPTTQIVATFLVATIALITLIDSFPLEVITSYLPSKLQREWEDGLVGFQYELYDYIEPIICAAGLWQGIWDISLLHEPHERISFQAKMTFTDDSELLWFSPDFANMSWLEKRQHGRILNYFAALPTSGAGDAAIKLCDELRYSQGDDMVACELIHRLESDPLPPPPQATGTFAPAHGEMERHQRTIVTVHYCVDQREDCEDLLDENPDSCQLVLPNGHEMSEVCADSCGTCLPLVEFNKAQYYEPYTEPDPLASQSRSEYLDEEDDYDDEEDDDEEEYYNGAESNHLNEGQVLSDVASALASVQASSAEMLSELLDDDIFEDEDIYVEGYQHDDEDEYETAFNDDELSDEEEDEEEEDEYDEEEYEDEYDDDYYDDDDDYYDEEEEEGEDDDMGIDPAPSAAPVDQSHTAEEELEEEQRSSAVTVDGNKATGKEASLLVPAGDKKHEEKDVAMPCEGTDCDDIIHMLLLSRGLNATNAQEKESVNF